MQIICKSLGKLKHAKLAISPQTQENISNWRSVAESRRISQDLTDRFSLNFPYSYMAMGRIFCASLDDFLCVKLEISFKTQENISKLAGLFGTQAYILKFEWSIFFQLSR